MRQGYSLIELMVVVTLVGVFVGLGALNMHGVSDAAQLQAAADQVATAYRLAQAEAARSGTPR